MNIQINYKDSNHVVTEINRIRLSNKDKWQFVQVNDKDRYWLIKFYNTYIQVFRFHNNGITKNLDTGVMDQSVSQFKTILKNGFQNN